jgi:hypothetical protein
MIGSAEREQPEARREPLGLPELFPSALIGEVPSHRESAIGSVVQAYELIVDASDAMERRGIVLGFCLQAAAMGYQSAFPMVTLAEVGYRDQDGRRPLSALYFFLTPPATTDHPPER